MACTGAVRGLHHLFNAAAVPAVVPPADPAAEHRGQRGLPEHQPGPAVAAARELQAGDRADRDRCHRQECQRQAAGRGRQGRRARAGRAVDCGEVDRAEQQRGQPLAGADGLVRYRRGSLAEL